MIDADHFKSINDSFGHPAGDAVLQGIAALVQCELRSEDICCRFGGEEFSVILPETTPEGAATLFDRMRELLSTQTWPQHPERKVTVSIGIAGATSGANLSPLEWMGIADANLYKAKKTGRNRVVTSEIGSPAPTLREAG